MDDLNMPRTEASCPVPECPWKYDLTNPQPATEDNRVRMRIPPPRGEHLAPAEIAAGRAAVRPLMAAPRPVRNMAEVVEVVMRAAYAQDEGVVGAHLGGHSYAELAAAFGDGLGAALELLGAAGYHPPVSIPMPHGPRLVAYWEDDGPASGYRCSVCRTVRTSGPDTASHFTDRHVFVTAGVRGLVAGR